MSAHFEKETKKGFIQNYNCDDGRSELMNLSSGQVRNHLRNEVDSIM